MSRYQKGKTNLDFTEARDSEWQWRQLGHMQVCISLQTDNHTSSPPLSFLQAGCPSCRPTNSVKPLKAKMHQIRFPPRPCYSTPIDLLAVFMGPTSEREEGRKGNGRGEGMKEKRRREEKEGEGKVFAGPMSNYFQRACERLHGKTYCLFVFIRRPSCRKDHIRHEQP